MQEHLLLMLELHLLRLCLFCLSKKETPQLVGHMLLLCLSAVSFFVFLS